MNNEEKVKRVAEIAVKECHRNPNAHSVEECVKCPFHPRSCNVWQLAEKLIDEGYHKTIWHKVADGDLPKEHKKVAFFDVNYDYYIGSYAKNDEIFHTYIGFDMSKNYVIAWIELPEYKE